MKLKPVLLACLLGLACVQTYAQTNDLAPEGKPHVQDGVTDPRSYYSRKAEGWFFYNEKERPEEKEEEPSDPTQPAPPAPPEQEPQKVDPEKVPFSSAWFRKNMQFYLDLAIDQPTEKNVKTFYYLQRIMMDKASAFADMSRVVVLGNPLLDANSSRPISTWGGNVVNSKARQAKKEIMNSLKDKVSLIYLFNGADSYTTSFSPIVKRYETKNNIYIKAVSVDGSPDASNSFPNAKHEPKAGEAFGVSFYPALYMYTANKDLVSICQGLLSESELTDRIILFAHKTGVITDEEYNATRKYFDTTNMATVADELRNELATNEDGLFSPDELIQLFEGK